MTSDSILLQFQNKIASSSDKVVYPSISESVNLTVIAEYVKTILMRLKNQLINFIIFYTTLLQYNIHTTHRQLTKTTGRALL